MGGVLSYFSPPGEKIPVLDPEDYRAWEVPECFVGTIYSESWEHNVLRMGMACRQGPRDTMEDATVIRCQLLRHPNTAFVGVFDGHGGFSAAKYLASHLVTYLDETLKGRFTVDEVRKAVVEFDSTPPMNEAHCGSMAVFALLDYGREDGYVHALLGSVGDSACYACDGKEAHEELVQKQQTRALPIHSWDDPSEEKRFTETVKGWGDITYDTLFRSKTAMGMTYSRAMGHNYSNRAGFFSTVGPVLPSIFSFLPSARILHVVLRSFICRY